MCLLGGGKCACLGSGRVQDFVWEVRCSSSHIIIFPTHSSKLCSWRQVSSLMEVVTAGEIACKMMCSLLGGKEKMQTLYLISTQI